ncbi:MAG: hypothetical protein WC342_09820 [Methanoregula sp.]|jgi:hypothetical protein
MSDFGELITIIIAGASFIGACLVTYLFFKRQEKIHEKTEDSKKVKLSLYLMKQPYFSDPEIHEIIFGFFGNEKDGAICNLRFEIANTGLVTAKDIELRILFPLFLTHGLDDDNLKMKKNLKSDKADRESAIVDQKRIVKYTVAKLNPGESCEIFELINIVGCVTPRTMDVKAKDSNNVPVTMTIQIDFCAVLEISLSAYDFSVQSRAIKVRTEIVKNQGELFERASRFETEQMREQLVAKGLSEKTAEQFNVPYLKGRAIIVYPGLVKHEDPNAKDSDGEAYVEDITMSKIYCISPKNP